MSADESKPAPKLVLGTMEFGRRADNAQSLEMVQTFLKMTPGECNELDTALMYGGGQTEKIMGGFPDDVKRTCRVATKANPWDAKKGGLSKQGVQQQLASSLTSLKPLVGGDQNADAGDAATDAMQKSTQGYVDLFYLHAPDHSVPIAETLAGVDAVHRAGRFRRFGLSNYAAWQVARIHAHCVANKYIVPTVYQGMYNLLTRAVEPELLPCLRAHNMSFYAYNPLAGGVLTGRYNDYDAAMAAEQTGRFFGNSWAEKYRARFLTRSNCQCVCDIQTAIDAAYPDKETAPTLVAASLRWMLYHSQLSHERGDALIIGASSHAQLVQNLSACVSGDGGGALAEGVVAAMDAAWAKTSAVCPCYFR